MSHFNTFININTGNRIFQNNQCFTPLSLLFWVLILLPYISLAQPDSMGVETLIEELNKDGKIRNAALGLRSDTVKLSDIMDRQRAPDAPKAPVEKAPSTCIEIRFVENEHRFWSQELADQYIDYIVRLMLSKPDYKAVIRGHSDIVGKPEICQQLSKERAEMVKEIIIARGVPANRLRVEALGQSKPKINKASGLNRRVEICLEVE
jgi:outer membrane protein OmpA-like peptidoglycan-associated protein